MEISVRKRQGNFSLDVSFQGSESGVTALFGESGAGKTSVINMVAGLTRPDSGRITINGFCLFDSAHSINVPTEKRRIGYVFQDGRLLPHLSVLSNLVYGMNLTPKGLRFVTVDQVVGLLGIGHLLHRRPAKLSGGEKQRVAIGRALLTSPAMLLMDEPLASLDAARKSEVLPFITRLSREFAIPILYVSHSVDEILHLASRIVIMEKGKVLACGALEDIYSRPDLGPLLGRSMNGSVLSARVEILDDGFGMTHLEFGGRILKVQRIQAAPGQTVRVLVLAESVDIVLDRPIRTSFVNSFPAQIQSISDDGTTPFVDVCLDVGQSMWSRIPRRALLNLDLHTGTPVFALVKQVFAYTGM
ncbi:MAG: molybdenum ABC transporter ATP-binding protein [Pseudomonadota bacterium]